MESKHTPGPWVAVRFSTGFVIDAPLPHRSVGEAKTEADARLIAAAPDLLAVTEAVLLFHSGGAWDPAKAARWTELTGSDEATTKALCDAARAAIAKARSE